MSVNFLMLVRVIDLYFCLSQVSESQYLFTQCQQVMPCQTSAAKTHHEDFWYLEQIKT